MKSLINYFIITHDFSVSDPNRWSKNDVKRELTRREIEYDENNNKSELVEALRKNIGEETLNEIKGNFNNC
jgi:hypothetical protein